MMNLTQMFRHLAENDSIALSPAWTQGRAHFGGLTGGLMLAKLQHFIGTPRRLRSLTVSFVGPMDLTQPAEFECRILRVGKSVLQGEVHLSQCGNVQAVLLAAFGEARESRAVFRADVPPPQFPPAESLPGLPEMPQMPAFLQNIDLRWAEGPWPFTAAARADFGGYFRLKNPGGEFSLPHLLTLADAFPPSLTVLADRIVPASSLTWTFELIEDVDGVGAEDFWTYRVRTDAAGEGYGHSEAKIWNPQGRLCAISRQTCTVFD